MVCVPVGPRVGELLCPFMGLYGLRCCAEFVEVDDAIPVFPGLVQLPQQLLFLSLVLLLGSVVGLLLPCNSSFLDAVLLVDLAQQRVAHPAARELFHEVLGPVLQRHAGLPRQRLRIHQPIDLMRL